MFEHVKFGVSDHAASKAFFLKALESLGGAVASEGPPANGVEMSPKGKASPCLFQTRQKPACAGSAPARPRELPCGVRHRSGRTRRRSGLPRARGLGRGG